MTNNRISYLEGLRGLAALLIVFHHYGEAFVPGAFTKGMEQYRLPFNLEVILYNTPLKLPIAGSIWLYVFLALSGMVITYSFKQKDKTISWLKTLCLNRYTRLIGPILTTGLLIFVALKLNLDYNAQAAEISGSWWWLGQQWQFEPKILEMLWQQGVLIFYKILPLDSAYNSSLWVIPYFFLGTFLLTILLGLGAKVRKWRWILYFITAAYFAKTLYLPLIMGVFLGEALNQIEIRQLRQPFLGWLMLLTGIYFGTYPTFTAVSLVAESWYAVLPKITYGGGYSFYHTLGAGLIIGGIMLTPLVQRFLAGKMFIFWGTISYAMYVVHLLWLNTLASWILVTAYGRLNYNLILFIIFLTCIPLTILSAYLINKYIEQPMGRVKISLFN